MKRILVELTQERACAAGWFSPKQVSDRAVTGVTAILTTSLTTAHPN